jgi:hypothetical protein
MSTTCEALLPAAKRFAEEEINVMTNSVVDGNKSHKLGHSRTISSHRRPIYSLNDLRERFGKRFLRYRRAVDLNSFGTGQQVMPRERADLHGHASLVVMSLQKRRYETASASFSLGSCYVDHVEAAEVFLLCGSEPGVSSDVDGSLNPLCSPVARGSP